jgi:small subunit ribosomal protein S3
MSHRVHPKAFRIKEVGDWLSRGFYGKNTPFLLEEDFKIRSFLGKELKQASVEKIEIERFPSSLKVIISAGRPGLIIGRGGENLQRLKTSLVKILGGKKQIKFDVIAVRDPWASAVLMSQWVAQQIEKRVRFRRVLKQALSKIMSHRNIEGAKVQVSGRLNGVEMARTEWLKQGKLPRQTIRADIDYGQVNAFCSYGVIGVKVWIYKGEKLGS